MRKLIHSIKITFSGSYVRSLFNKSKPASDRVGRPENDVGGNFSRSLLYLQEKGSNLLNDKTLKTHHLTASATKASHKA